MPDVKEILKLMDSPSKEEVELVSRALKFAEDIHLAHYRLSGEPFIIHPFETAKLLAELNMGAVAVSAGLLHDSLEDGSVDEEKLEKHFGKEILFLVQGVTKLGKIKYRGAKQYIESLRKFFVAVSQDIRVLIIKLCDRLHNMRTLAFQRPDKRYRIALETLEIYAPLSYRLSMRKICHELENLAFPHVYPKEYEELVKLLHKKKKETEKHLSKFYKSLKKALAKKGVSNVRSDYRIKSLYSLYHKLERIKDIEKVYDISALRIIVPTVEDCYSVLGVIHGLWRPLPGRIKDYIAFPKPNGYRSLHTTIFTGDGSIIEMQIRTEAMHKEAEFGIASHLSYKEGFDKKTLNPHLLWLSPLLPKHPSFENGSGERSKIGVARATEVPRWLKQLAEYQIEVYEQKNFIKDLKADFFEKRVFIFTPKGDVVDLPFDSSPVDFAYAIHSEVGDHTFGAKVNGKLVSLDTKLKNGDIVEIITKKGNHPTARWLESVKTAAARKHIQQYLIEQEKIAVKS